MFYVNLLYRELAKMETNAAQRAQLSAQATSGRRRASRSGRRSRKSSV